MKSNEPSSPGDQASEKPKGAGKNGNVPPAEHRWKPGTSGNRAGRKTAGATAREWLNILAEQGLTEDEIRTIAQDMREPLLKRAAAERLAFRHGRSGRSKRLHPLFHCGSLNRARAARRSRANTPAL